MHYPFVAVCRGRAALAASGVVCYNAGPRQFNSDEPWLSGFVKTGKKTPSKRQANPKRKPKGRNGMASRRAAIGLVAMGLSAWACLAWSTGGASALDYPTRPVRFVVGYPAGGATDIIARLIGQKLSERMGQQFVIENKPGAGNNIGTASVVNAAPDGYTVLLINPANFVNASLYANLNFNFIRDIAPVASFNRVPNVMTVAPGVPAKTVAEFIAYVKDNPGKVNMASSGNGTSVHLSGELFMAMSGAKMLHVPYKGAAPAITDLLGDRVQVIFDNMPSIIGHIKGGALRALAVTTATRSPELPDVPTVAETVPGYEASALFGMGAPKQTPPEIIAKLNQEINAVLADPEVKQRLIELGGDPLISTPEAFGEMIAAETEKWEKVVKFAGLRID
jgi:tripartite-type tricarboxylate transporter receptor subunit TctC